MSRGAMNGHTPQRRTLHHTPPAWVAGGSVFFVTICAQKRGMNSLCREPAGTRLLDSAIFYHERGE